MKVIAISAAILVLSAGLAFAQAGSGSGANVPETSKNANGMAQPPGIQNEPKTYQPANPAPDARTAPTSSSAGVGSESGGHPENQKK
jgi:hypothetical protein